MIKTKQMIVVDCYVMPKNIKQAFFECTNETGNDCYVYWCFDTDEDYSEKHKLVDRWLKENGITEDCLIRHCW